MELKKGIALILIFMCSIILMETFVMYNHWEIIKYIAPLKQPTTGTEFPLRNMYENQEKDLIDMDLLENTVIESSDSVRLARLWQKVPFGNSTILPVILTEEKTHKTLDFLHNLTHMFDEHGIEYMMFYGTLLGSYHSHTLLPWDDDLDVVILDKHAERLERIFKNSHTWNNTVSFLAQCQASDMKGCIWKKYKLYWTQSPWKGRFTWTMPFADVTTYSVNKTHVWMNIEKPWLFPRSVIYPFHKRPFGGRFFNSPRVPYEIFNSLYWNFMNKRSHRMVCGYPPWDHWKQATRKPTHSKVACQELIWTYPFVDRSCTKDGRTKEDLTIGNTTYYSFTNDEPFSKSWQPHKYELNWVATREGQRKRSVMERLQQRKQAKIKKT